MMKTRSSFFSTVFLLAALGFSTSAWALQTWVIINPGAPPADTTQHVVSMSPHDNEALAEPPAEIRINFSQPVSPARSYIKVYDVYNVLISNERITANGVHMSTALPALPPGRYRVKWNARCMCDSDDEVSGTYHFIINGTAPEAAAAPPQAPQPAEPAVVPGGIPPINQREIDGVLGPADDSAQSSPQSAAAETVPENKAEALPPESAAPERPPADPLGIPEYAVTYPNRKP
jgi:methionine-rich copper-binding protein CopC